MQVYHTRKIVLLDRGLAIFFYSLVQRQSSDDRILANLVLAS